MTTDTLKSATTNTTKEMLPGEITKKDVSK